MPSVLLYNNDFSVLLISFQFTFHSSLVSERGPFPIAKSKRTIFSTWKDNFLMYFELRLHILVETLYAVDERSLISG